MVMERSMDGTAGDDHRRAESKPRDDKSAKSYTSRQKEQQSASGVGRRDIWQTIVPTNCKEPSQEVLVQGKINGRTMLRMRQDNGADRTVGKKGMVIPETISERTTFFSNSQGHFYFLLLVWVHLELPGFDK